MQTFAVYATRVNPYRVVDGFAQKSITVTRERVSGQKKWEGLMTVRVADMSDHPLFQVKGIKEVEPWLIDVVGTGWKDIDVIATIENGARKCGLGKKNL